MVGLVKILLLIFLIGCVSQIPLTELEDQLNACDVAKAVGCEALREEVNKRWEDKRRREQRRIELDKCPVQARCYYGEDAGEILKSMQRGRRF